MKRLFILLAAVVVAGAFVGCEEKETPEVGSRGAAQLVLVNECRYTALLEAMTEGDSSVRIEAASHTTSEPAKVEDIMGANYYGAVQVKITVWDEERVTERTIYQNNLLWIDAFFIYTFTIHEDFSVDVMQRYAG